METTAQQPRTRTESYYVIRHKASGLFVSAYEHLMGDTDYYLQSDDIRQFDGSSDDTPYPFWVGDQTSGYSRRAVTSAEPRPTFAAEARLILDELTPTSEQQERELSMLHAEYSDFEVLKVQTIYEIVGEPISVE
jgi:hypothetical protein